MDENGSITPFILKPARITNYTQFIALLRLKQQKYKAYLPKSVNTAYASVLGEKPELFKMENVIEGYLHTSLMKKYKAYEKEELSNFDRFLSSKIQQIKKANEERLHSIRIGDVAALEDLLFVEPTKVTFKEDMLFDLYLHLKQRGKPLDFLRNSYYTFIKLFTRAQGVEIAGIDSQGGALSMVGDRALKAVVASFTTLRFNREEFAIEAYEGRYLWAELFVFYRIGKLELVRQLLSEYDAFFELMTPKFKSLFLSYLDGKPANFVPSISSGDDRFKRFLFTLLDGKPQSDGVVIASVDDYLWMRMISSTGSKRDISKELEKQGNPKTLFMVYILTKRYKKAIDVLLTSDFNLIAKFFLLREFCLEQNLPSGAASPDQIGGFRAAAPADKPLLSRLPYKDECSSSSFSLDSLQNCGAVEGAGSGLSAVNPVFLNFMFSIVSKMTTNENKVKFIEMLKHYGDYYAVVPYYIIKYELFDIIGCSRISDSPFDYCLDADLTNAVMTTLKKDHNKRKLVRLHKLMPCKAAIELLADVLEEAILIDEPVDTKIVEEYVDKTEVKGCQRLRELHALYIFNMYPSVSNLRSTIICTANTDLEPYKFVIEKVIPKAVDVSKAEQDRELAKYIFRLGGQLELNAACCNKIAQSLATLI